MLERVRALVGLREVRVSDHGASELDEDSIRLPDLFASVADATAVEDYPADRRGASVLALHRDRDGRPVHVVWAIAKGSTTPAVLVTAWRPDPLRWSADFLTRRRR